MELVAVSNEELKFNYKDQLRLTLSIISPMIFTRLLSSMSGFIGMIMIAKLGSDALAAGALITSIYTTLMMVLWSFFFPVGSIIAKYFGQKNNLEIGKIVRQSIVLALLISIPVIFIFWVMSDVLIFFGQPLHIVIMVDEYFRAIILGIIPCAIVVVLNQFFNGIFRPHITTFTTMINVILTVFLSYGFLYGNFGLPNFSVAGLGYAISITYWINLFLLLGYLMISSKFDSFELFKLIKKEDIKYFKTLFHIGWPISFQYGSELLSFTAITFLMGSFGRDVLAAQQVSLQCALVAVMFPFAISQASAVLVGHAYGEGSMIIAKKRGYLSLIVGMVLSFFVAIIFLYFSKFIISFYLNNEDQNNFNIISLATMLLAVGAVIQFFDSIRNILTGALRGFHDTHVPMVVGVVSCWVIGIPCAYLFSFVFNYGPVALRVGFLLGIIFGAINLFLRFHHFSKTNE